MKLRKYITNMDPMKQIAYADRCGIAPNYLRMHIKYASKNPSVALIKTLAKESEGMVSLAEVLEHFGVTDSKDQ